jgi:hypothetical protein
MDKDYLTKLFINEAKPALDRHSGSGGTESPIKKYINSTGSAMYLFKGLTASDLTYYLTYNDTENALNISGMFDSCRNATKFPHINTSKATNMYYMHSGCSEMEEAPFYDLKEITNMQGAFRQCGKLRKIPAYDVRKTIVFAEVFYYDIKLEEIWIKNIKNTIQVGSGTTWGHLLTVESLIHLIYELRDTGKSLTLTVGSANLEKLANVYVKTVEITDEMRAEDDLIDEKLPFVVCESTDEGAMLITNYVTFKNWEIN